MVIDVCGNLSIFLQMIMMLDMVGLVLQNVFVDVCNDLSMVGLVMVYDECIVEVVMVELMEVIGVVDGCGEILICMWMVIDVCGNVSIVM